MHVRVRLCGKPEIIVVVPSKLTKIEAFRKLLDEKFGLEPSLQRLLYGGKLLDDGFSFHDYNIKMNDVIQLMKKIAPPPESEKSDEDSKSDEAEDKAEPKPIRYIDAPSRLYRVGDLVDVRERVHNAWFEGKIIQIVKDPEYISKSKPQTSKSNGTPKKSTRNSLNKNDTAKSSPVKRTPERKAKTENGLSNSSKKENGLNSSSNSSEKENGLNTPSNSSKKENGLNKSSNSGKKENGFDKIDLNSSSTKSSPSPKNKSPKRGITDYFSKGKVTQPSANSSSKGESKENGHSNDVEMKTEDDEKIAVNGKCDETNGTSDEVKSDQEYIHDDSDEEVGLLYKAHFDEEEETSLQYCKLSEIRPRAKKEIDIEDLKTNQTVLLNYNIEEPHEKGFWYDFTVHEVKKLRKNTELIGTLFHGKDVPLHNVKVKLQDKVYAIETVIPLNKRSTEYEKSMITPTEKSPKEKKNTQEDQGDSCSEESWVSSDNFEGDFSDNDSYADPNFDPTSGEDSESEEDVSFNKRGSGPLVCTKCRDAPGVSCKECGCNICSGKNQPETIILCDECNQGYHMTCLTPALSDLPTEDWYCADCKRDPASVVAPGGKVQKRKPNQHKARDWGRGMACQGKTTTCAMPANHFGPIPGIEVGMAWRFRIQLSESGVHRPPVSGIHGRDVEGAYSIVLSGGYEDDVDHGFEFTYTGSGGRDLSGNKRTADQSSDQTLTRENKALARNCAVKEVKEEGGDSQEKWRDGRPVRVVRSYKMIKHFPEYAPKEGIRYDGIYKVVKYYPEKGKSGFRVWKYLLRRDDPTPAPWEAKGKMFPIIYPDGYLEAEAEKQAQKERDRVKSGKTPVAKKAQKRPLRESNGAVESDDEEVDKTKKRKVKGAKDKDDTSPPKKKMKTRSSIAEVKEEKPVVKTPKATPRSATTTPKRKKLVKTEKISSPSTVNPFTLAASKKTKPANDENAKVEIVLSPEDRKTIEEDSANKKLWEQCLDALEKDGKKGLVDKVTEVFLCIICQDVPANPVTTSCSHNFCMSCLKLAFKSNEANICPACRNDLSKEEITHNELLKTVLLTIMPGYDTRKK